MAQAERRRDRSQKRLKDAEVDLDAKALAKYPKLPVHRWLGSQTASAIGWEDLASKTSTKNSHHLPLKRLPIMMQIVIEIVIKDI